MKKTKLARRGKHSPFFGTYPFLPFLLFSLVFSPYFSECLGKKIRRNMSALCIFFLRSVSLLFLLTTITSIPLLSFNCIFVWLFSFSGCIATGVLDGKKNRKNREKADVCTCDSLTSCAHYHVKKYWTKNVTKVVDMKTVEVEAIIWPYIFWIIFCFWMLPWRSILLS